MAVTLGWVLKKNLCDVMMMTDDGDRPWQGGTVTTVWGQVRRPFSLIPLQGQTPDDADVACPD